MGLISRVSSRTYSFSEKERHLDMDYYEEVQEIELQTELFKKLLQFDVVQKSSSLKIFKDTFTNASQLMDHLLHELVETAKMRKDLEEALAKMDRSSSFLHRTAQQQEETYEKRIETIDKIIKHQEKNIEMKDQ